MTSQPARKHQCMIYRGNPREHMPGLATVAMEKLAANWRCLYLNSPGSVADMRLYLQDAGVDVEREVSRGSLLLSSGQSHLLDGNFEVDRMMGMLQEMVKQATDDGYEGLWASGDMCWEFGKETNFAKLLEYEFALERFFQQQPRLEGICQYNADTLPEDAVQWGLCTHTAVYINETLSQPNPHYSPAKLLTYRREVPGPQLEGIFARPANARFQHA